MVRERIVVKCVRRVNETSLVLVSSVCHSNQTVNCVRWTALTLSGRPWSDAKFSWEFILLAGGLILHLGPLILPKAQASNNFD